MKVTFLGATHEVTGSMSLISSAGHHILIDCGMEQGADIFVNEELSVNPADIDCLILTHAHIDHSGKIPLLVKNGFKGKIYSTEATQNLCNIMLLDSAHIQASDAEWQSRKAARLGEPPVEPLYDTEDVAAALRLWQPCGYNESYQILENVEISFTDVGHLLGSSAISISLTEAGETKTIVFSGDIGNSGQAILRDPEKVKKADYLVIESTYGDRLHEARRDVVPLLAEIISRTFERGGNVVIPSFAVGRTQELLYFIRLIKKNGLVPKFGDFPVYVDSPLANEATGVFMQSNTDYFDDETKALIDEGINPLWSEGLKISVTSDDSKAINFDDQPKVIISASGMCEAGRIRHHLKHNLWRRESSILFVGYQAEGTLGRLLVEGAREVRLFGESVTVAAEICTLPGISGHADRNGLISWLNGFDSKPATVFVNHGDDSSCTAFVKTISDMGYKAVAPYSGTTFDMLTGILSLTEGIPVVKPKSPSAGARRQAELYGKLLASERRLASACAGCEGMANKDIARIISLIDSVTAKVKR